MKTTTYNIIGHFMPMLTIIMCIAVAVAAFRYLPHIIYMIEALREIS